MTLQQKYSEMREEGRAEGREEGLAEGRAEGREEGRMELAIKLYRMNKLSAKEAADLIGITEKEFKELQNK